MARETDREAGAKRDLASRKQQDLITETQRGLQSPQKTLESPREPWTLVDKPRDAAAEVCQRPSTMHISHFYGITIFLPFESHFLCSPSQNDGVPVAPSYKNSFCTAAVQKEEIVCRGVTGNGRV